METNRAVTYGWAAAVAVGILLVLGGIFCVGSSFVTGLVSIALAGVLLVGGGIAELVAAFRVRRHGAVWLPILSGVLSIVCGLALVARPFAGLTAATLLISAFLVAAGLVRGIAAIGDRYPRWGFDALYGGLTVALGLALLATWPASSLWVVGTIVGVELISRGIAWIAGGLAVRHVAREVRREPRFGGGAPFPA